MANNAKKDDVVKEIVAKIRCVESEFKNAEGEVIRYQKYYVPFEVSGQSCSIPIDLKEQKFLKPLLRVLFSSVAPVEKGVIKEDILPF